MKQIRKIALMAVGDDAWMGGIQYIINILHALDSLGSGKQKTEVHLFKHAGQKFSDLSQFQHIDLVLKDAAVEFQPFSIANRAKWLLKRRLTGSINPRIEEYMLRNGFDYVYPSTLSSCGGKLNAGAWIADFQYRHFPDAASPENTKAADRVISQIAGKAAKVVFSSAFCQKECENFFPAAVPRSHVMPFAVFIRKSALAFRDFDELRKKYDLARPFLMVSNLFAPTKNHRTLFEALGLLNKKGVSINLVCTGSIVAYTKPEFANEILAMLSEYGIRNQVHLLGLIPRPDQLALYRMAVALVQPSVSEGWSTCVEEAKALGKNIVISDIGVHREQAPARSWFFSPMDAQDLAVKIGDVWEKQGAGPFPRPGEETAAFELYEETVQAFGRRFMEIAAAE